MRKSNPAINQVLRRYVHQATLLSLGAITLLALTLRIARLDFQPLWWDEGYSVFFATRDLATMLARTAIDIHPPLYYALLQVWILFVGKSDIALRLLSVGIGVASVPLIYVLARGLFNHRIGIVTSVLLTVSALHVYYSQEVRMYGLVTLLALVSMTLELALLSWQPTSRRSASGASVEESGEPVSALVPTAAPRQSTHSLRGWYTCLWILYVIVTTAALYAEYYAAFVVIAEIAVAIYWRNSQREGAWGKQVTKVPVALQPLSLASQASTTPAQGLSVRNAALGLWILAWLAVFILYLPWVIYAGPKLYAYVTAKVGIEQYSRLDPLVFVGQHLIAFSVGHLSDFGWLAWSAVLFVALAVLGIYFAFRGGIKFDGGPPSDNAGGPEPATVQARNIVLIYLLVPLFCGWLVNLVYPFHPIRYERLLLFAAPPFYLLIALGLDALLSRQRRWGYAAMVVIVLISAVSLYDLYTVPRYPDEDYRDLVREMQEMARPGDVVLAPYPWQIGYLESYYHGSPLQIIEVPADQWIAQPGQMDSALRSVRGSNPRVWLLAYQTKGRLLESEIANDFADDYHLVDDWFHNTRLQLFAQGAEPALDENAVTFAPALKLDSYGVGPEPVTAGASFIRVRLHWEATSNAYSYSLRLVDSAGMRKVQQDQSITFGNEIQRLGVFVPPEIGEGEYDLVMIVYLRVDGSPLTLPDGGRQLRLARIAVAAP